MVLSRSVQLSVKNGKLRLQSMCVHQNWTIKNSKYVAWFDESSFQLLSSDDGNSVSEASCLFSAGLAAACGVGNHFLAHIFTMAA